MILYSDIYYYYVLFTAVEEGVGILDQILQSDNDPTNPESLVKEAAQGHTDVVKDIITRHPEQVSRGMYPLSLLSQALCCDNFFDWLKACKFNRELQFWSIQSFPIVLFKNNMLGKYIYTLYSK